MSADIELTWEWPADRTAEQKLLIKVLDVKDNSGLFSFNKTPSIANNLPDPVTVSAKLMTQEGNLKNKTIELSLPKLELRSIKTGGLAILGIMEGKICICIKPVAAENVDVGKISCP